MDKQQLKNHNSMGLSKDDELFHAATTGDIEAVREYMAFWGDPKHNDSEALRGAAKHGHAHVVELLLPVSDANGCNAEALKMAALNGHAACVSLLVPHTDLDAECKLSNTGISVGQNALRLAAKRDCIEIVQQLSALCGNNTKLLLRAARGGHQDEVRHLIPMSDPKADDSEALRWAAYNGHSECVKLLIPVSEPKTNDSSALYWAVCRGHTDCVDLLYPVSDPKVALIKLQKDHPYSYNKWEQLQEMILSEQLNTIVDTENSEATGRTVFENTQLLIRAINMGDTVKVQRLIPMSDPKSNDSHALRFAADKGYTQCVELLIAVSDPRTDDSASLRLAAISGHQQCVDLLYAASDPSAALARLKTNCAPYPEIWTHLEQRVEAERLNTVLREQIGEVTGSKFQRKM